MATGLARMPYAPSSREAVIARCQKVIEEGAGPMPRSGPWKHRIVDPKRHLPVWRGRTEHKDVWNLPDPRGSTHSTMDQGEWEEWHERHARERRRLTTGEDWRAPASLIQGYQNLPKSSTQTKRYQDSLKGGDSSFDSFAGGGGMGGSQVLGNTQSSQVSRQQSMEFGRSGGQSSRHF